MNMPGNNASHKRLHTIMQPNSLKCNNTEAKKWNHITINSGKHTLTSGDIYANYAENISYINHDKWG